MILRTWLAAISNACWGIYLLLTSIYCLLAFLPYTYVALIKEPPYAWLPWFAHHQPLLYFVVLGLLAAVRVKDAGFSPLLLILAFAGVFVGIRPFLPDLTDSWSSYRWSLVSLLPLLLTAGADLRRHWAAIENNEHELDLLPYSGAVWIAAAVSAIYWLAAEAHAYVAHNPSHFGHAALELTLWSLISHITLAALVLSLLNLLRMISRRTTHAARFHFSLTIITGFGVLCILLVRFLSSALSFQGWAAFLYAASLAAALTLWIASLSIPLLSGSREPKKNVSIVLLAGVAGLALLAVALPTLTDGSDWNGLLQGSFALVVWLALGVGFYRLRPRRTHYSWAAIFAVVLLSASIYKGLQETAIWWAKSLGSTDDDFTRSVEAYAGGNASLHLVNDVLSRQRVESCGDLCRILRENTNIRDAAVKADLQLVDQLQPTHADRPNIFFFVIDSLRPDYLGAYNSQVDFTPNLDAFARDSIVVHNVYTQYAGTSLSEPAIWAGSELLHAHYQQPFSRLNSLEKLARADGYHMIVSYDEILRQLLAPSDDLIKLDTDKQLWNQLELCSTVRQFEHLADSSHGLNQPLLFYTQPKNVHQFAHNDLPLPTEDHWQLRRGFNNRVAHEVHQVDGCMGQFLAYLKSHGLYDNSIIILTSDHGDATGEFGRSSHSLSIFPEVMRVPLVVHLPANLRARVVYDESHISALTDITPSLYYLLGHRPLRKNPLLGHPLFVETAEELAGYQRTELFLASDERAVYGLLTDNGRFLYTTYDSPARSFLFDLSADPNALRNTITPTLKKQYDDQILEQLHMLGDFYGYKPGVGSLLAAAHR